MRHAARKIRRSAGADLSDHGQIAFLGMGSSWNSLHIKFVSGVPVIVRGWLDVAAKPDGIIGYVNRQFSRNIEGGGVQTVIFPAAGHKK